MLSKKKNKHRHELTIIIIIASYFINKKHVTWMIKSKD